MTTYLLETERLRLRELRPDDVNALHGVLGDPETMRYYPHPFTREETTAWIDKNLERYAEDGHGLWAMELKTSGELIGNCGPTVQRVDGDDLVEIGWHVRRDLWRRGFATEAAEACRDHAFDALGLPRVISLVRPENKGSCRVAEKIGMTVWRQTLRGPGWVHHVYSMTGGDRAALDSRG